MNAKISLLFVFINNNILAILYLHDFTFKSSLINKMTIN